MDGSFYFKSLGPSAKKCHLENLACSSIKNDHYTCTMGTFSDSANSFLVVLLDEAHISDISSPALKHTHSESPKTPATAGSQLSEPRLSVSKHLDVGSRHHVSGTSGIKMLQSLEFCYRRKQSCYMNNFTQMLQRLFQPVR